MILDPDRFLRKTVDVLAKRAAFRCSNPSCGALTSGPANDADRSVIVGEAAHIYGAKPGSARYNSRMATADRCSIANAIWLCCNCHKIVDADPAAYPSDLLYEWRQQHELFVTEQLGRPESKIERRIVQRELEPYSKASYMARQIIIDKPSCWELRLTNELLKLKIEPLVSRWHSLEKQRYALPVRRIASEQGLDWIQDRLSEIGSFITALCGTMNHEFEEAWGLPGQPGSSIRILQVCNLLEEVCQQLLAWEEQVRFTAMPDQFHEVAEIFRGLGGRVLDQIKLFLDKFDEIFSEEEPKGIHYIAIVIDLPIGWTERCEASIQKLRIFYNF